MMKKILPVVLGLGLAVAFVWTMVFLYNKSKQKPVVHQTAKPFVTEIVKKTVATGAIVPRREVAIKPRISGVLEKVMVAPGDYVKQGQPLAQIKIIPNMVSLNAAESSLRTARISLSNAEKELNRYRRLLEQGLISESEFARYELDYNLRKQERAAAASNLQLVKSGAAKGSDKVQNVVKSTVEGMVIEVPEEEGASVTEANNFNPGTTIASIADMNDMIFEGNVDESEVGKIKEGMELSIVIGAIDGERFKGRLEYISPKGQLVEGAIQFEIRAAVALKQDVFIRAGYSANADIVIDSRKQVLAINEALLQFDKKGTPFVEVETGKQQFEQRFIEVGLSDGVNVEVLSGIDKSTVLKKPSGPGRGGKPHG